MEFSYRKYFSLVFEFDAINVVSKQKGLTFLLTDCLVAMSCPALVLRVVSSSVTSVGTIVNVSCPAGQKLQTGHDMMKTLCTHAGDWSPQVPNCIGKCRVIQLCE